MINTYVTLFLLALSPAIYDREDRWIATSKLNLNSNSNGIEGSTLSGNLFFQRQHINIWATKDLQPTAISVGQCKLRPKPFVHLIGKAVFLAIDEPSTWVVYTSVPSSQSDKDYYDKSINFYTQKRTYIGYYFPNARRSGFTRLFEVKSAKGWRSSVWGIQPNQTGYDLLVAQWHPLDANHSKFEVMFSIVPLSRSGLGKAAPITVKQKQAKFVTGAIGDRMDVFLPRSVLAAWNKSQFAFVVGGKCYEPSAGYGFLRFDLKLGTVTSYRLPIGDRWDKTTANRDIYSFQGDFYINATRTWHPNPGLRGQLPKQEDYVYRFRKSDQSMVRVAKGAMVGVTQDGREAFLSATETLDVKRIKRFR